MHTLVARCGDLAPVVQVLQGQRQVHHHVLALGRLLLAAAAAKGPAAAKEEIKDVATAAAAAVARFMLPQPLLTVSIVDVTLFLI